MNTRRSAGGSLARVLFAALALLLVGLLHVAYVARTASWASTTTTRSSLVETVAMYDATPAFRVGSAMPARGPPLYHPHCAFLARDHLEDRFVRDDACFTRPRIVGIIRALVQHAAHVLATHNITYFLASGTLLGAFRYSDVIPHDDDGDVAIDAAGFRRLQSQRVAFDESMYALDVWDSPHYTNGGRDAKLSARLIHKASALYVDVFVFHDRVDGRTKRAMVGPLASDCFANCVHCRQRNDGRKELLVPREWVYPLQPCVFGGQILQCPAKIVEYLTHEYGEHFRDPI